MVLVALIFTTCKKDQGNHNGNNTKNAVLIKGKILGLKSSNSLSDAKKIYVVTVTDGQLFSHFVDIINGSFADTTMMGIATSLIFLDGNNKYIGTLSNRGLNFLPLNNLSNGINTTIDLSTLTLVGTNVIPSHDPFGNEIIITDQELNGLKDIDGFFESLAKNIDADNDGILDALNHKQLFLKSRFYISPGHWGINNTSPVVDESDANYIGYSLELQGDTGFGVPNSIVLSGPADSPYPDINTYFINPNGHGGFYSGIWRSSPPALYAFKKGTYTLKIDGNSYTMDFSNTDAKLNLINVIPAMQTNSDGKFVSFTLAYKLPNNTTVLPDDIITNVFIQLVDNLGNQYYTSPKLVNPNDQSTVGVVVRGMYSYTLATPMDISALKTLTVCYNDILGNSYFLNWVK